MRHRDGDRGDPAPGRRPVGPLGGHHEATEQVPAAAAVKYVIEWMATAAVAGSS
jgi:hypothetical protein